MEQDFKGRKGTEKDGKVQNRKEQDPAGQKKNGAGLGTTEQNLKEVSDSSLRKSTNDKIPA